MRRATPTVAAVSRLLGAAPSKATPQWSNTAINVRFPFRNRSTGWISLARVMAIPKFVLVLITIVYILIGIVALIVRRVRTLA